MTLMKTTIIDVARKAGVSTGTVSNTLSGKRPVSEILRKRIFKAIAELNYRPNRIASGLVTGQTRTLGVIIANFYSGMSDVLKGIDYKARLSGYSILVSLLVHELDPMNLITEFISRQVEGIVCIIPEDYEDRREENEFQVDNLDIPIVFVFNNFGNQRSLIRIDNELASYRCVQHLIEHGCRNIGHISGSMRSIEALERRRGWEKALRDYKLDPLILCESDWSSARGAICAEKILEKWDDLDALFVNSDDCALGVIEAVHRLGRKIPEDIKVIGFDDMRYSKFIIPSLTTVRQDFFEMGVRSVIELSRLIANIDSQPTETVLPTELVLRQSCGCIPF